MNSMRINTTIRAAIAAVALGTAVTACSADRWSSPSALPDATAVSGGQPQPLAKRKDLVYAMVGYPVAMYDGDAKNPKPLCEFSVPGSSSSFFPGDPTIDSKGDYWAPALVNPDINTEWEVLEFAPKCGKLLKALKDPNQPSGVAFNSKGTLYVANASTVSAPGDLIAFAPGATTPTKTFDTSPIAYAAYVAVDASDNVYVLGYSGDFRGQYILKYVKGRGKPVRLKASGYGTLNGITFDKNQNMLITDYQYDQIDIYAPPYKGAPSRTIPLLSGMYPGFGKLNAANDRLYVSGKLGIEVLSYPAGKYLYTIVKGTSSKIGAGGLAVAPIAPR